MTETAVADAVERLVEFRNFVTLGGVVHPSDYRAALDGFEGALELVREFGTRTETLEAAIKNALGILAASYGDADPYVRCAADMLWQALEEREVKP